MKPVLYIAATPIGSLHDASPHLIEVLKKSDLILCEDTRHTKKLLQALQIENKHLESLHAHNENQKSESIVLNIIKKKLQNIVLVSDAGTPAISDPGAYLVKLAHQNGFEVRNVPGPSSLACAMASHGFIQPKTVFIGFIPRTKPKQIEEFKNWQLYAPCVLIFFESPKRIVQTFKNLLEIYQEDTNICVSREISKKFEQNLVMSIADAIRNFEQQKEILGEYVVSIELTKNCLKQPLLNDDVRSNSTLKTDCKLFAQKHNISAKNLYQFIVQSKNQI